jgi:hypothetical protein
LGLIIYFSLKIDWGKLIGRWFPWAIEEDVKEGEKKTGDSNSSLEKKKD